MPSFATRAWVASVGDWFDLIPQTGASPQALVLVTSSDGQRQWKRRGAINRQFLAATFWSVSPATGSDEAIGWGMTESEADSHPLATMIELNRRLVGWNEDGTATGLVITSLSIHLLSDVQTTSAFAVLTNLRNHNSEKFVRLRGTLTAVDGSATNRIITAYQPAVHATNTEREITISGLGTTPQYVGKLIQTTDGLKTAVVMRQNSSNHLSISQVRDGRSGLDGDDTEVSDFVVNDHVTFYDATKLALWPFPPDLPFPVLGQVRLDVGASGMFPQSNLGISQPLITQCLLGSGVASRGEYLIYGGAGLKIESSALFATHSNAFESGTAGWFSVGVLIAGDGPFIGDYALTIGDEASFTPIGGGGVGLRHSQSEPCTVTVLDTGSIASFGMINSTINLIGTHGGLPGNLYGSDSNGGGGVSAWYGSGNTGYMLVLGQGATSKFPKSGITVVTSFAHPINLGGTGIGDTFHNYDWADIPIFDLSTDSYIGDSNPGTSGGSF